MPRPLSVTVTASPDLCSVTVIESACPFRYSSTELSTISQMRWWRPLESVEPMYILGRLRTGSRPSSTWIDDSAVYRFGAVAVDIRLPSLVQIENTPDPSWPHPPAAGRPVDQVGDADDQVAPHRTEVARVGRLVRVVAKDVELIRSEGDLIGGCVLIVPVGPPVPDRSEQFWG